MARPMCQACGRPQSVCLCDVIPGQPLWTSLTKVIVLQHPHERRHKLATAPLLADCLARCSVIIGRRFRRGLSAFLDALAAAPASLRPHLLLLFPTADAVELETWCASNLEGRDVVGGASDNELSPARVVLLVVDGTWQHAREMVKASMPFLSGLVVPVCLPFDVRGEGLRKGHALILRKEPFKGCISTLEAVARALACLEHDGLQIQDKLLCILHKMVTIQASFTPIATDDS